MKSALPIADMLSDREAAPHEVGRTGYPTMASARVHMLAMYRR